MTDTLYENNTLFLVSRPAHQKRITALATIIIGICVVLLISEKNNKYEIAITEGQNNTLQDASLNWSSSTWCPFAKCYNTDLCHPCDRRFLIVLATGRSASTTLTWMLNKLPEVRMSGENNDTIGSLKRLADSIVNTKEFQYGTNKQSPWGHNYSPNNTMSCVSQHMIESINPPMLQQGKLLETRESAARAIIGFKTIRFFSNTMSEQEQHEKTQFLLQNFPCSRIIINIDSDIDAQAYSLIKNFHSGTYEKNREKILKLNTQLKQLAKKLGSKHAYLLDKAEWTRNVTKLNEAVSWLGFNKACYFEELLEFNIDGYKAKKTDFSKSMDKKCKLML